VEGVLCDENQPWMQPVTEKAKRTKHRLARLSVGFTQVFDALAIKLQQAKRGLR
jgi:hypothetical protein